MRLKELSIALCESGSSSVNPPEDTDHPVGIPAAFGLFMNRKVKGRNFAVPAPS